MLESGRPLTRALPLRLKLELRAIIAGGLRILHRIDAAGGDVFKATPRLGAYDWLAVGCRAIVPARRAPV